MPLLRPQTHQVYSFSHENRFDHVRGIAGFLCFRNTSLFLSLIKIPGKLLGLNMHTLFLAKIWSICWCLLASLTTAPVTESGELGCSWFVMFTACQAAVGKALHFSRDPVFWVSMVKILTITIYFDLSKIVWYLVSKSPFKAASVSMAS